LSNLISENERKHTSANPLRKFAIRQFFGVIDRIFPPVETVLDAGCGEGYDVDKIMRSHPDLTMHGIDISMPAVAKSRMICQDMSPIVGSVLALPYPSDRFDLVMSLEVLEHLAEPEKAIAEYIRVSRRYVMFSVPNEPVFRGLRMMSGMNIGQFGNHPEHVQHWNMFSFKAFLQAQGLIITQSAVPAPFIWSIVLCEIRA
jgi:ubiquinone/menaquinone biosynthesis C-methylase UbiE